MPDRCVLGVDIGTSSCKVTATKIDGTVLATVRSEYPTYSPHAGWAEQDPEVWVSSVAAATVEITARASIGSSDVCGIGITSAAHVTVLLDSADRPARRAVLWNDTRSAAEATEISDEMGELIRATTYNSASASWSLAHLAWVRRHEPEIWRKTSRICLSKDYVARALTDSFITDRGTATSSLLFNARDGHWSAEICTWIGVSVDQLPEVVPVRKVVGHLSEHAASLLGLTEGTPVVNGTLDSATETYAAGACRPADTVIRLGTAGGVHVVSEEPFADRRLITYPHPTEPLWYSQAGTSAAGASIEWARTALGGGRVLSHRDLERLAEQADPGSDGVIFHPYLSGERCPYWDSSLRGSFSGLSTSHGPSHLARAVVEGVACSLFDAYSVFRPYCVANGPASVVGGGCRNALLLDVISAVFGRPLQVLDQADSSLGAALIAIEAITGERRSSGTAAARTVEPDGESRERYARLAAEFAESAPNVRRR